MKLDDLRNIASHISPPLTPEKQDLLQKLMRDMGLDPDNLYQELEMSSPYVNTHRDTSFSNAGIKLHSHTFFELIYCANTCGAEYLVGSQRYRLRRGDVIAIPPGTSHRPLLPAGMPEPYVRYILWITPRFFRQLEPLFPDGAPDCAGKRLLRTEGTKWEHLGELFRRGVEEAERRRQGWEAMVLANTTQILVLLWRMAMEGPPLTLQAEKPDMLERVMAYIEANLSGRITLADTARHFYVSESTISQLFSKKMGVSFYRAVTQRRLISAKRLILEALPMETVAGRAGFSDYSTFYRAFKHEYGISPRQYRNLYLSPHRSAGGEDR